MAKGPSEHATFQHRETYAELIARGGKVPVARRADYPPYDAIPCVTQARAEELAKKYPHLPVVHEPTVKRGEVLLRLPKKCEEWVTANMLAQPRDLGMVSVFCNLVGTILLTSTLLYLFPSHLLGCIFLVYNSAVWLGRFILTLHYAEHRPIFNKRFDFLNLTLAWFLAPFFGIPTGMYRAHHVIMHHIENNITPEDLSSTESYQRDNILHFFHYAIRYWINAFFLPIYAIRKGRTGLGVTLVALFTVWAVACYLACRLNFIWGMYTLVIPALVTGLALHFGNWCQHILVHPTVATMPQDLKSYPFNCALTYQVLNHIDNHFLWNDGYHVTHHINSRKHWEDMPMHFMDGLEQYVDAGVIAFDGMNILTVGFCIFSGNYKWLYKHFVHFSKDKMPFDEFVAFIKARLVPIHRSNKQA